MPEKSLKSHDLLKLIVYFQKHLPKLGGNMQQLEHKFVVIKISLRNIDGLKVPKAFLTEDQYYYKNTYAIC